MEIWLQGTLRRLRSRLKCFSGSKSCIRFAQPADFESQWRKRKRKTTLVVRLNRSTDVMTGYPALLSSKMEARPARLLSDKAAHLRGSGPSGDYASPEEPWMKMSATKEPDSVLSVLVHLTMRRKCTNLNTNARARCPQILHLSDLRNLYLEGLCVIFAITSARFSRIAWPQ